jgi:ATP-dependent DNA helicase DinG
LVKQTQKQVDFAAEIGYKVNGNMNISSPASTLYMHINDYFIEPDKLPSILSGYHPRPTQIQAAKLIDEAMLNYKDTIIEAPTGSGKTMAYLVPAFAQGKRTIVSTKTKQLMMQLFLKDIPVMTSLFGERSVALLKGRKNYFCTHRFMRWIYPNSIYYQDVVDWYNMQEEVSELPRGLFDYSILDKMSADSHQCLYAKCSYYSACPFYAAKDAANTANIVITNHFLLLTDIAMKADDSFGAIFEPTEHIIFDEAHSLADIFAQYAGAEIPLRRLMLSLFEHKDKLPAEKLNTMGNLYTALQEKVTESKVIWTKLQNDIYPLMDICFELVAIAGDSDLKDEFTSWNSSFNMIDGEEEGLRMVEQRGRDLVLRYIPMSTGGTFVAGLRQAALSSVFISATLTTNGSFDYFLREMGLESVTTAIMPPVFEMKQQARLLVPKVPYDKRDMAMKKLVEAVDGSVLIICNSLKRMQELIDYMSISQDKAVFSQDDGDWSTFTSNSQIVLVGCAALREGIDLAGGDFRCVIIDKLPFEYYQDLYLAHKAKLVEAEVGNSFVHFSLPRAVLYFKQAVGRLIRHESDRGLIAVFDDRILTKSYGSAFIEALGGAKLVASLDEAVEFLG